MNRAIAGHTRRLVLISLLGFGLGCGANKRDRANRAARIIQNGDAVFEQRTGLDDLNKALEWYSNGAEEFPNSPRPLSRLARAHVSRAYVFPEAEQDDYATAREHGLRCLMLEDAFGGLVTAAGGSVTIRAVKTLDASRIGCIAWTSIAWSRWLDDRGVVGASIDLEATEALARQAVELNPTYAGGLPYAALGLALALPPKPLGPDLVGARSAFAEASQLAPERLSTVVDLAQYVSAPEGKEAEWNALLRRVVEADPGGPFAMENKAAIQRAEALLSAGLDARWSD